MKNAVTKIKVILITLLAALCSLFALGLTVGVNNTALADNEPSMTLRISEEYAKAGETVDVKIYLVDNPGVASLQLDLSYEDILTLDNVAFNGNMGGQSMASDYKNNGSPVTLIWVNGFDDYTEDCVFAKLTFTIADNAEDYAYSMITADLDPENTYNSDETNINVNLINGFVCVQPLIAGDINGDGNVNNKDITRLFRYIAHWDVDVEEAALDVNGDGSVNNKDITRLFRYIAHWDVEVFLRSPLTVTFNGNGGTLVSGKTEQIVKYGGAALAPVFEKSGYEFDGFDVDFTHVTANITVTANWITSVHIHDYSETVFSPSCTEKGYTVHSCNGCDDSYIDTYVDELGHTYGAYVQTTAPTCTDTGVETATCSRCGDTTTRDIPATGEHNYVDGVCSVCGDSYFTFTLFGNDTYEVEKNASKTLPSSIVIPSTYNGKPVTSIGWGAFYGCSSLTSVTIPDSVTSIGVQAFTNCSSLTCVTIPDSLTSISNNAFDNCPCKTTIEGISYVDKILIKADSAITNANIKEDTVGIGNDAFFNSISLTSINIPDSVTSIGRYAFYNCSSLTSITFGENSKYESIGERVFYGCSSLTSITIPDSVTSIGESAFQNCSSLTSVTIGNSVTSIGRYAFYNCSSLTSIIIGNDITSIESFAFDNCSSLTSVYYSGTAEDWNSISMGTNNNYLTNATRYYYSEEFPTDFIENYYWHFVDGEPVIWELVATPDEYFTFTLLSDDTYEVKKNGSKTLPSSIVIPSTYNGKPVTSIGNYAFWGCSSLTSITIPDSVTSIKIYAFQYCSSLTSITIPDSVISIGGSDFKNCSSLTSIEVDNNNENYKSIDGNLYSKNGKTLIRYAIGKTATEFIIPNSVTSIGIDAFNGCSSLTTITIPNSVTSIGSSAFDGCSSLTSITIPDSVTSIEMEAFSNCSSLTSITIPDSVTSIRSYAFSNCSSLTSIEVDNNNENYKSIDGNLYSKNGKTLIQYAIGKTATEFTIQYGVTSIESAAFYDCSSLTSITIPDSVTSIGYSAFNNCINLTSITIPDSVTSIGSSAFKYCSSLTSVTIGNSVRGISQGAFDECHNLTNITFNGTIAQWNAISKGSDWKRYVPATVVHCTNGDVAI